VAPQPIRRHALAAARRWRHAICGLRGRRGHVR
jgi:hypothetical protein